MVVSARYLSKQRFLGWYLYLFVCTSGHPHFLELEKVLELFYEVSDLSFLCHFSCLLEGLISEENASAMMLYLPMSFLFQKNM